MTTQLISNSSDNYSPLPNWGLKTVVIGPYIDGWHHFKAAGAETTTLCERILHVLTGMALFIPILNRILYIVLRCFCTNSFAYQLAALAYPAREKALQIDHAGLQKDIIKFINTIEMSFRHPGSPQSEEDRLKAAAAEFKAIEEQVTRIHGTEDSYEFISAGPNANEWMEKMIIALRQSDVCFEALLEQGNRHGFLNQPFNQPIGGTLLHYMAKIDHLAPRTRLYLRYNVDLTIQDAWGNTALIWAIANANNETAMDIIQKGRGAHLDLQSQEGNTALHLAVAKGYKKHSRDGQILKYSNLELIEALVAHHCNVNLLNKQENSPLHLACLRRDAGMIQCLLKAGANKNFINRDIKRAEELLQSDYRKAFAELKWAATVLLFDEKEHENNLNAALEAFTTSVRGFS